MYAGNMVWSNLLTGLVIAVVIGFTLLPIWPNAAKKILWYCSVTFLIATLSFCLVRFVLFLISWILGYDFWIFPRLFDESLSFQDSFKPVYTFEKASAGQGYYRMGSLLMIVGFVYWACTQPTEFDGFIKAQKEFIDDLYSGNLLADVAHNSKEHMDRNNKVPNMADLIREMEAEALAEKAAEEEQTASFTADETTDTVDITGIDEENSAFMDVDSIDVDASDKISDEAASSDSMDNVPADEIADTVDITGVGEENSAFMDVDSIDVDASDKTSEEASSDSVDNVPADGDSN
jgi:hypothetical protein